MTLAVAAVALDERYLADSTTGDHLEWISKPRWCCYSSGWSAFASVAASASVVETVVAVEPSQPPPGYCSPADACWGSASWTTAKRKRKRPPRAGSTLDAVDGWNDDVAVYAADVEPTAVVDVVAAAAAVVVAN